MSEATIAELEAILNGGPCKIMINPDGSLTTKPCDDEKERRIYYQNIVYAICNIIDSELGTKLVCGTIEEPSTEVQDKIGEVFSGEPVGYSDFIKRLKIDINEKESEEEDNRVFNVSDMLLAFHHGKIYEHVESDCDLSNDTPEKNLPFYDWLHKVHK